MVFFNSWNSPKSRLDNTLTVIKKGELYGFTDNSGKIIIAPEFEEVRDIPKEKIVIVKKDGYYGLLEIDQSYDKSYFWIIKPTLESVSRFDRLGVATVKHQGKFGFLNCSGWIVPPILDYCCSFNMHQLARVVYNKKWGVLDLTGQWRIPPKYEYIDQMTEYGLAAFYEDWKWGLLDNWGNCLLEPVYDFVDRNENNSFCASVSSPCFLDDTYRIVASVSPEQKPKAPQELEPVAFLIYHSRGAKYPEYRYGYVDKYGDWKILPRFLHATPFNKNNDLARARSASTKKWGLLSRDGQWVVQPAFDKISPFMDKGTVAFAQKEEKWGLISKDGTWVTGPNVIAIEDQQFYHFPFFYCDPGEKRGFNNGFAPFDRDHRVGFIDRSGCIIANAEYKDFCPFSVDGYASVKFENELWGVINRKGGIVLQPIYKNLSRFAKNGLAAACRSDQETYGYINVNAEWIIPSQFNYAEEFIYDTARVFFKKFGDVNWIDRSGKIVASLDSHWVDSCIHVNLEGKFGLIDEENPTWIIPPQFDAISGGTWLDKDLGRVFFYKLNGLWGIASSKNIITKAIFDEPGKFDSRNKIFAVCFEGFVNYINSEGNFLFPFEYKEMLEDFYQSQLAKVKDKHGNIFYINLSGKKIYNVKLFLKKDDASEFYGYVDKHGEWVLEPLFEEAYEFSANGLAPVKIQKKIGFINTSGEFVISPQYDDVGNGYFDGRDSAIVIQGKETFVIDMANKILAGPLSRAERYGATKYLKAVVAGTGFYDNNGLFNIDKYGKILKTKDE